MEQRGSLIARFYRAWNQRDVEAIVASFDAGGAFADPLSRNSVSGDALRAHVTATVGALPELEFSLQRTMRDGEHVATSWALRAVCKGALDREISADGVPFSLEGMDLFHLSERKILSVRRIFDRRDLAERLGMQCIVEPIEVGSMAFGYSLRDWVSKAKPALLGMTWIQARDEDEKVKIRAYARRILKGFHDTPGFIGVVTGFTGLHGFTFTAWESEEALRAGVHGPEHVEAMRGFHQGTSAGVFTSVWQPLRLNRMWLHCATCGVANDAHRADGHCQKCGMALPEPSPYVLTFRDPSTFACAAPGCDALFLMRPPAIADTKATLERFVDEARRAGVGHVVFLSVAGAGANPIIPHHNVEAHLAARGGAWTALRPGFFAQNLGDAYRLDIVEDSRLYVPAGSGRAAFIDVRDVAEVAALAFLDPARPASRAHTLSVPGSPTSARSGRLRPARRGTSG